MLSLFKGLCSRTSRISCLVLMKRSLECTRSGMKLHWRKMSCRMMKKSICVICRSAVLKDRRWNWWLLHWAGIKGLHSRSEYHWVFSCWFASTCKAFVIEEEACLLKMMIEVSFYLEFDLFEESFLNWEVEKAAWALKKNGFIFVRSNHRSVLEYRATIERLLWR